MSEVFPDPGINESIAEIALMEWLGRGGLGYQTLNGGAIAPGSIGAERESYREVVLIGRLRTAVERLNRDAPETAREEAIRKTLRTESPSLLITNSRFHDMLVNGVDVEVMTSEGVRGQKVWLIDFNDPDNNDWLAVNQFTVHDRDHRRPDVVIFVNGLPLGLVELKNPADEDTDIWSAFNQIQTYKEQISPIFTFNEVCVISDGVDARIGSLTSPREWFLPWRTIEGAELAPDTANRLEVLAEGVFEKSRFLDLIRNFIVFQDEDGIRKVLGGYHQFHATRKALTTTIRASRPGGDRRAGVVWHTQGSGKSLTMAFYAGKLISSPELENPTIVVITDRNDLDDQLFGVFAASSDLLRQEPVQAGDRSDLRARLQVAAGGVVFTTIQKFLPEEKGDRFPLLSPRANVIVIADEAHRTQYGFVKGFARHMRDALPNATFVAFTGTPVELDDRDTRAVFGDYIDIYDIQQAVADEATVPIYYENRQVKLDLKEEEKPKVDEEFEDVVEGEEDRRAEGLKRKWAQLEAVVGSEKRLTLIAKDIVEHFEDRLSALEGKAMIVCMSRRICVELYEQLVKLKPEWHSDSDDSGVLKVVMTGSASDPAEWQQHIRSKSKRESIAKRFKDAEDPFKVVIVRDMWLTGFDAPSLHTMYIDKPLKGHTLMQAIARVNRVFRDKPGGLAVDYIGIVDDLRKALSAYTESGGGGEATVDLDKAVALMIERLEICRAIFHRFDASAFLTGSASDRLKLLPLAQEHVLKQPEGKERFVKAVTELSKAFALAVSREEAQSVTDEVAFFQTVKAQLVKTERIAQRPQEELDQAIKQIVSKALAPEGVIDVFQAAGLKKPDIGLLSEEFLTEVRELPHRNLAVELLKKLLNDEIRVRQRRNVVQSRAFSEMLDGAIRRYQARAITTAQVIEELIALARDVREAQQRGTQLGLTDEELAFYDALESNDSAVAVLGDDALRKIAVDLTRTVRRNATIDWTVKETARANLRRLVRRILRKHGYPPDKSEKTTQTVLEQAVQLGFEFAEQAEAPPAEVDIAPFEIIPDSEAKPYENCIPLLSLKAAAGQIGDERVVDPEAWVSPNGRTKPSPGLFVAQVIGESMNRRIPNGSYCVFRYPVEGSRQGRIVLVEHRDIADPDLEGPFTLKIWESKKEVVELEAWRHTEIRLKPDTTSSGYEPIVFNDIQEQEFRVVAEFLELLPIR